MANLEQINHVISTIYDASACDEGWDEACRELSALFGDAAVGLDSRTGEVDIDSLTALALFDPERAALHFEEYSTPADNPAVAALLSRPVLAPFQMHAFIDARTYDSDPSVQAILKPQNIDKGILIGLEKGPETLGFVTLMRRKSQAAFDAEDEQALALIGGHLTRALTFRRRFRALERARTASRLATDGTRHREGVLHIANTGAIANLDATAANIIANVDELSVRAGHLASSSSRAGQQQADLHRFLTPPFEAQARFVMLSETGDIIKLELLPERTLSGSFNPQGYLYALLSITPHATADSDDFGQAYGLTPAEARVIGALSKAANATAAAEQVGIARQTMKSHLVSIYAKTGCPSLGALMQLIGRFCV
ncbi:MAG: hypothetical protein AAFR04_13525 [Pseudomonadota bacterium]